MAVCDVLAVGILDDQVLSRPVEASVAIEVPLRGFRETIGARRDDRPARDNSGRGEIRDRLDLAAIDGDDRDLRLIYGAVSIGIARNAFRSRIGAGRGYGGVPDGPIGVVVGDHFFPAAIRVDGRYSRLPLVDGAVTIDVGSDRPGAAVRAGRDDGVRLQRSRDRLGPAAVGVEHRDVGEQLVGLSSAHRASIGPTATDRWR